MRHPLEQRVSAVRRQAIGLVRAHALGLFASACVAILLAFGLCDYFLRFQDRGARWILSCFAVGLMAWAGWRLVRPALRYRASLVQVAQRIEQRFPELGQRLSSAIDFLHHSEADVAAGSRDLRRAVISEAQALSSDLDFSRAIDSRPIRRRGLALAVVVTACLALLGVGAPRSSLLALERLLMPWRDAAWPRRHSLEFVRRPQKLAVGDDFEVELADRAGRLPPSAEIQLRYPTPTGTRTETNQMHSLGDRMTFRLDNVTQGFAYRARGGDDDSMPWTELEVIQPPHVRSLEIVATPPAYTALPQHRPGRVAKVVAGSTLVVRGNTDKPIVAARLRSEQPGVPLPEVMVTPDGLGFVAPASGGAPWRVEKSAGYWIELIDGSGLPTGRDTRLEIQAIADSPPVISWQLPGDHTFVAPRAFVSVKCLVRDDLAVQRVQLRYLRPGMSDQGELVVDLYSGPPQPQPQPGSEGGDSHTIDYQWDLSRLAGLVPGDVLALRITAEDYRPQLSTTIVRRLTIITPEELESRLGLRQSSILGQIAEALRLSRETSQQLAKLQIRQEENGRFEESDLNSLQSGLLNHRQIGKLLGTEGEGVEKQLEGLLAELASNRVEGKAISDRMQALLTNVRKLNRGPQVEVGRYLTDALKAARAMRDGDASAAAGPALMAAASRQSEVIESLEAMLGTLAEWDSFSRLAREIGQIRGEQQQVANETQSLRLATLTSEQLAAEQRAAARQLRTSELELGRRLDKVQSRMHQLFTKEQDRDDIAAATLADAIDAGRRLAIGGRMRDAAEKLGQFRFGEAHREQEHALEGLKELLDLLSSRREDELARTIKSLRGASTALNALLARQRAVQADLDAAMTEPPADGQRRRLERLAKELDRLAQDIEPLRRHLQRLRAAQAALATQLAGEQNVAAGHAAAQGDAAEAGKQAGDAKRRLEEAQREVEQSLAEAQRELMQQQLARVEQWIDGLLARQKNVVAESVRLERSRGSDGQLGSAMQGALRSLAAEQRMIAEETEQLQAKTTDQPAFAFALTAAATAMRQATSRFQGGQTDDSTQELAQTAADRLAQMLAALLPDSSKPPESPASGPPSDSPAGPTTSQSSLAALKLLELMQDRVSRRTAELEAIRSAAGQLTDNQSAELQVLADEQGRLAEFVFELIRASAARPEDNPDLLPQIEPEGTP
jgi:hypothetical protein